MGTKRKLPDSFTIKKGGFVPPVYFENIDSKQLLNYDIMFSKKPITIKFNSNSLTMVNFMIDHYKSEGWKLRRKYKIEIPLFYTKYYAVMFKPSL